MAAPRSVCTSALSCGTSCCTSCGVAGGASACAIARSLELALLCLQYRGSLLLCCAAYHRPPLWALLLGFMRFVGKGNLFGSESRSLRLQGECAFFQHTGSGP